MEAAIATGPDDTEVDEDDDEVMEPPTEGLDAQASEVDTPLVFAC